MKKNFPDKKVSNEKTPGKTGREHKDNSITNISCIQLTRKIKRDKLFFSISAELSIYSN